MSHPNHYAFEEVATSQNPVTIQYRVIPVTRYQVTRYEREEFDKRRVSCGSIQKGEFDSERIAYEVAYALCKEEHQRLGWPIGDVRIQYPKLNPRIGPKEE